MAKPIARVGDSAEGICYQHHSATHWTGTIQTGSGDAICEGSAIARVGDTGNTSCGHTFQITEGSSVFTDQGIPVARQGDAVIVIGGGSGVITGGSSVGTTE